MNKAVDPLRILGPTRPRGHHRRPSSIEGSDDPRNLSPVPRHIHQRWHDVVGNMCVPSITRLITVLSTRKEYWVAYTRRDTPMHLHECPVYGTCAEACVRFRTGGRRQEALIELIKSIGHETRRSWTLETAIDYINDHLLDPDYELRLVPVQQLVVAAE